MRDIPGCIDLSAGSVHVWLTRPDTVPPNRLGAYLALLSADERARYHRFARDGDRETFLVAHGQLRLALSRYAPVPPALWQFRAGRSERPIIDNTHGAPALHFSLSHTDGLIAIAISRLPDIGIDVERIARTVDHDLLAPRVFTATEIAWIRQGHAGRFLQLWTLKEAYAKARGLGLSIDFRHAQFDVSEQGITARFDPSLHDDATAWHFQSTQPTPDHICAVAVRCAAALAIEIVSSRAEDL